MDRFRELVSKLNVGDLSRVRSPSPQPPTQEQTDKIERIVDQLPLTKAFAESLPRHKVIQKAAENDKKAVEATELLHRVDNLINSHVSAAHDLRKYVSELVNVKTTITATREQAYSIHQQLVEIDREIKQAEAATSRVECDRLQQSEDAIFELYAKKRRAELNQRKQEYAEKLLSFQRDRYSVSQDFQRPNSGSRSKSSASVSSRSINVKGISKPNQIEVQLDDDAEQSAGLDDFLGAEETPLPAEKPTESDKPKRPKKSASKPKKVSRLAGPGTVPGKAAPARPKIDIMADEDFFD
ncbi:hypothetical protein TWF694_009269 [Orbilia ellipsospora]|uniref:Uncharacterized protein n=1 Tax=Orbilia ellipsospora TaxID=2528407 RepID=A0AAV9XEZ8_9PEZI